MQSYLSELCGGYSVNCPELIVEGARIMINAHELGYKNAQELCDALYEDYSIATKPATVYASPKVKKEWAQYVQVTAPWNNEMLEADRDAFKKIYEKNKNKIKFQKIMKKLRKKG